MGLIKLIAKAFKEKWTEEDLIDYSKKLYQQIKREDYKPELIINLSESGHPANELSKLFKVPYLNIDYKDIKMFHKEEYGDLVKQKKILVTDERYKHEKYINIGKILMEDFEAYDFRMATLTLSNDDQMPEYFFTDKNIVLPYEK